MELILVKTIETLLTPPGLMFGLIILGAVVQWRFATTGKLLMRTGIVLLIVISLPIVTSPFVKQWENFPALDVDQLASRNPQAIVVLGGGRYKNPPEYKQDTVSATALPRVRYAALLQRKTKLPILVTGGVVFDQGEAEGLLMKRVIEDEYHGLVKWVEAASRTTQENAVYTQTLLAKERINTIVLVTHALHMRRATQVFERAGFTVIPAPVSYHTRSEEPEYMFLLPHANSINTTNDLFHEWLGWVWYRIRY
jgi:uncharacterized SAM-binding protein YcdF (DUF218 family)